MACLSPCKETAIKRLLNHDEFKRGFDRLREFPGLWIGLELGNIEQMLSLSCPEEQNHYLEHIHISWQTICVNGRFRKYCCVQTVQSLERRAPATSNSDRDFVIQAMRTGLLFPKVTDSESRAQLEQSILGFRWLIPSIKSLHENDKYLQLGAMIMKELVIGRRHQMSVHFSLRSIWRQPPDLVVQNAQKDNNRRFRPSSAESHWDLAYKQLWIHALREFPDLGKRAPRKEARIDNRNAVANPSTQFAFVRHARQLGFRNERISERLSNDPRRDIIRQSIVQIFDSPESSFIDRMVSRIVNTLPSESSISQESRSDRFCGYAPGDDLQRRWGIPFLHDYEAGQDTFFLFNITERVLDDLDGEINAEFLKADFIRSFFGSTRDEFPERFSSPDRYLSDPFGSETSESGKDTDSDMLSSSYGSDTRQNSPESQVGSQAFREDSEPHPSYQGSSSRSGNHSNFARDQHVFDNNEARKSPRTRPESNTMSHDDPPPPQRDDLSPFIEENIVPRHSEARRASDPVPVEQPSEEEAQNKPRDSSLDEGRSPALSRAESRRVSPSGDQLHGVEGGSALPESTAATRIPKFAISLSEEELETMSRESQDSQGSQARSPALTPRKSEQSISPSHRITLSPFIQRFSQQLPSANLEPRVSYSFPISDWPRSPAYPFVDPPSRISPLEISPRNELRLAPYNTRKLKKRGAEDMNSEVDPPQRKRVTRFRLRDHRTIADNLRRSRAELKSRNRRLDEVKEQNRDRLSLLNYVADRERQRTSGSLQVSNGGTISQAVLANTSGISSPEDDLGSEEPLPPISQLQPPVLSGSERQIRQSTTYPLNDQSAQTSSAGSLTPTQRSPALSTSSAQVPMEYATSYDRPITSYPRRESLNHFWNVDPVQDAYNASLNPQRLVENYYPPFDNPRSPMLSSAGSGVDLDPMDTSAGELWNIIRTTPTLSRSPILTSRDSYSSLFLPRNRATLLPIEMEDVQSDGQSVTAAESLDDRALSKPVEHDELSLVLPGHARDAGSPPVAMEDVQSTAQAHRSTNEVAKLSPVALKFVEYDDSGNPQRTCIMHVQAFTSHLSSRQGWGMFIKESTTWKSIRYDDIVDTMLMKPNGSYAFVGPNLRYSWQRRETDEPSRPQTKPNAAALAPLREGAPRSQRFFMAKRVKIPANSTILQCERICNRLRQSARPSQRYCLLYIDIHLLVLLLFDIASFPLEEEHAKDIDSSWEQWTIGMKGFFKSSGVQVTPHVTASFTSWFIKGSDVELFMSERNQEVRSESLPEQHKVPEPIDPGLSTSQEHLFEQDEMEHVDQVLLLSYGVGQDPKIPIATENPKGMDRNRAACMTSLNLKHARSESPEDMTVRGKTILPKLKRQKVDGGSTRTYSSGGEPAQRLQRNGDVEKGSSSSIIRKSETKESQKSNDNVTSEEFIGFPGPPKGPKSTQSNVPDSPMSLGSAEEEFEGFPGSPRSSDSTEFQGFPDSPMSLGSTEFQGFPVSPMSLGSTEFQGFPVSPMSLESTEFQGFPDSPMSLGSTEVEGSQDSPKDLVSSEPLPGSKNSAKPVNEMFLDEASRSIDNVSSSAAQTVTDQLPNLPSPSPKEQAKVEKIKSSKGQMRSSAERLHRQEEEEDIYGASD